MFRRFFQAQPLYDVLIVYKADNQIKFFGGLDSILYMNMPDDTPTAVQVVLDTFDNGIGQWGIRFMNNTDPCIGAFMVSSDLQFEGNVCHVDKYETDGSKSVVYDISDSLITSMQFIGKCYPVGLNFFLGYSSDTVSQIVLSNELVKIGDYAFTELTNLTEVVYQGTIEQWNSLEKGERWYAETPLTEVQCSDGVVTLQ